MAHDLTAQSAGPDGLAWRLDQHQRRRAAGIPTISVLSGPAGLGIQAWRQWTRRRGLRVAMMNDPAAGPCLAAWLQALEPSVDLAAIAGRSIVACSENSPGPVEPRWHEATEFELSLRWEAAGLDAAPGSSGWWYRVIAESRRNGAALATAVVSRLGSQQPGREEIGPWIRGLVTITGPARWPALLGCFPGDGNPALQFAATAARLVEIATTVPELPVGLAVAAPDLEEYLARGGESREKALLREGILPVRGCDVAEMQHRLQGRLGPRLLDLGGTMDRLARQGVSAGVVDLLADAVEKIAAAAADRRHAPAARSAAEAFLFACLELHPETAGRFELNGRLEACGAANRELEIDLLARDLALAIEIDGYYHFREPADFRRDRRKDFALQRRGLLVWRCLAEDVVTRFEEVLDGILEAVRLQRERFNSPQG